MKKTMKALIKKYDKPGIWMDEAKVPDIGSNDVLIKILKTSICGTDIHIYNWDGWASRNIITPLIIGHEFAGIIADTGGNVKDFKTGELVSGEGHIVCGRCRNCLTGNKHLCSNTKGIGVNQNGSFAEYLALPSENVWRYDPNIPIDQISCFDPFGNAVHTVLTYNVFGKDVLITGAGPIGLMAAAIAKFGGAKRVVITDINDYRLKLAERTGVAMALNVREKTLESAMKELSVEEGFDIGYEMSGNSSALHDMVGAMANGGNIALLGIQGPAALIDWEKVVFKQLTIKGIYGREIFNTWYQMTDMILSGLDISPIITHRYPYTEFQAAFESMASGNTGKVILNWDI